MPLTSPTPDWQLVSFSADCDEDDNCSICGEDYTECGCPGPTQDEDFEYEFRDGVMWARRLPESAGDAP